MNEIMTKSLAQIVNNNHRAASVFEKYHLDFCCKGKRTLQQACEESQLNITEVISELEMTELGNSSTIAIKYEKLSLAQLSEYIVMTHHSYVKKEMPQILAYLEKVASKHSERHPELLKIFELFAAVTEEMEQHMEKEELVLFPRINEIEKWVSEGTGIRINHTYLQAPINMMEQEHDHAGEMLAEINRLTDNYHPPADACTTYKLSFAALQAFEMDLHRHVHLENNILFPKALQLFGIPAPYSLN
jgi:regulator of cell morphogenesis and NO signaling